MRNRSRKFPIGFSRLVLVAFVVSAVLIALVFSPSLDRAMAQSPSTTSSRTPEDGCCWIDVKTGKQVPTAPASGMNFGALTGREGVATIDFDGIHAHNAKTGQNFVRAPCPPPTAAIKPAEPKPTPTPTPTPEPNPKILWDDPFDLFFGYAY